MPLTSGSVTLKLAGGTYSTWAAFWDDLGDLTGDITCTVDASIFTENAGPAAITEDLNNHTLHVLPVSFPTTTDATTGARISNNHSNYTVDMDMQGPGTVIIEGMVFVKTGGAPYAPSTWAINTDFTYILRRNIVKGHTRGLQFQDDTLVSCQIYNNIVFDSGAGIKMTANFAGICANNTFVDDTNNVDMGGITGTLENNLAYSGTTTDYTNIGSATGNNNADSDATGEDADWNAGANNVSSISDPFNNLGADDFTITSEGVVGTAGKDLSGSFTTDFFGTTRINWSIGACEFITPSGIPTQMDYYRRRRA